MTFAGNRKVNPKPIARAYWHSPPLFCWCGRKSASVSRNTLPGTGWRQIERMATALLTFDKVEYGIPPIMELRRGRLVVLISDFLGPWETN